LASRATWRISQFTRVWYTVYGGEELEVIHRWEVNSLAVAAEGMKEGKDGMLWINDNTQTLETQKEVLIVNSNPDASIMGGIAL
jgi:hypothetical protein